MMAEMKKEITRADILPPDAYARERKALRQDVMAVKKRRRMEVGPVAIFHFESYRTMLHQVHEMLFIERGGEEQIEDELKAYNPLVPKGDELVATVMFEIDDPARRARVLAELGGIENRMFLAIGGARVRGAPEGDVERTKADGKTSSVHFVHFRLTPAEIAAFKTPGAQAIVGFDHANYAHMAVMPENMRAALALDFA